MTIDYFTRGAIYFPTLTGLIGQITQSFQTSMKFQLFPLFTDSPVEMSFYNIKQYIIIINHFKIVTCPKNWTKCYIQETRIFARIQIAFKFLQKLPLSEYCVYCNLLCFIGKIRFCEGYGSKYVFLGQIL